MDGFDHILNWELKVGSHKFPGKDGGTCINEAAVVAAGFEYRPVRTADDMPTCFSRPISRLAMRLNDEASGEERQRLLLFVTRLACADTDQIENEREAYIRARTRRGISFERGLEVLSEALAIGRQADPLDNADVSTKMSTACSGSAHTTSKPDDYPSALMNWLRGKKKVNALL